MCGESARIRFEVAGGRASESSPRSSGPILSAYVDAVLGLRRERGVAASTSSSSSTPTSAARAKTAPASSSGADRGRPAAPRSGRRRALPRPVDRHARLASPGHERALDRRGAAPARQERRMDVQPERAARAATRRNERARSPRAPPCRRRARPPGRGARAGAPGSRGARPPPSAGGRRELAAAAARPVGPRQHPRHVAPGGQAFEDVGPNAPVAATPTATVVSAARASGGACRGPRAAPRASCGRG